MWMAKANESALPTLSNQVVDLQIIVVQPLVVNRLNIKIAFKISQTIILEFQKHNVCVVIQFCLLWIQIHLAKRLFLKCKMTE